MSGYQLEAGARMALDVALGTAGAMGDERCGTEYLLFGVVATAHGDLAELCELFALDTMRLERAIQALRGHRFEATADGHQDPPLSTRAELAVHGRSLSGADRRSVFDLLLGCLNDPRSGAATVLRHLGIRIGEIRRLVELGAARLGREEVESLIEALDRRRDFHYSWWGPAAENGVARVALPGGKPMPLGRSDTAEATLDSLVAGPDGLGLTITIRSLDDWVLPPSWEPIEVLKPGIGSEHRISPDVVTIDLCYSDGSVLTNRHGGARFRADEPNVGALVRLGSRKVVEERNDRRRPVRYVETSEWWAWPLPDTDPVRLQLNWPAEAVNGTVDLDGTTIAAQAARLRHAN